jgi:phosphoribosylformylglycinamidine synthase
LESSFNRALGVDVVASDYKIRKDAYWFGEAQGRVIVSVSEKNKLDVKLNYKQYEFNKEVSITFNVPKNYKLK